MAADAILLGLRDAKHIERDRAQGQLKILLKQIGEWHRGIMW
jgi:hypothetical protein